MTEEDPKDVLEFVENAVAVIVIGVITLGEFFEKGSKKPPKKNCRQPPKYV